MNALAAGLPEAGRLSPTRQKAKGRRETGSHLFLAGDDEQVLIRYSHPIPGARVPPFDELKKRFIELRRPRRFIPEACIDRDHRLEVVGGCWAAVKGHQPLRLEAGDVFVVPHGDPYVMASAPGLRPTMPPDAVLEFFRHMATGAGPLEVHEGGGGPPRAQIVCGFLGCDVRPFNPVLEALPRALHLPRQAGARSGGRLSQLIDLTLAESRHRQSGTRCVLLHLSELLFVEVVRRYLGSLATGQPGWLSGLRDPIAGHALALLHDRPGDPWSLERLARTIGVSRSVLAERFTALIGQPPMRYLTRWRIQLACRMLSDERTKVSTVAFDVGYRSEAAFSRAFKAHAGTSPAGWRRRP